MKSNRGLFYNGRGWLVGIMAMMGLPAAGQELLRSYQGRIDPLFVPAAGHEVEPGNLTLGPVEISLSAALAGSYSDNIRYAARNALDDFMVRPIVQASALWPFSDKNSLSLALGVSYEKYVSHSEYDRFYISPGSELSVNVFIGEFRFNVYDTLFYSMDPFDVGSVSGEAEYGGLRNSAGLVVSHDFNAALVSMGYEHFNFISTTRASDPQDRAVDSVFLRAPFQVGEAVAVGPEAGASWTRYDRKMFYNDSQSYSAGVFASWPVTDFITLTPRAGLVHYAFENDPARGLNTPDATRFYFDLRVHHLMNEAISHSLQGGRHQQLGVNSDLLDLYFVTYAIHLRVIRRVAVTVETSYEHGDDSNSATGESYGRFWVGPNITTELAEGLSAGLAYRHTFKDSDQANRDYRNNLVTLSIAYRF